jgi:dephospho-CoA kinase
MGITMLILGLTGSIGMGKSTAAQMFADEGIPVHEADQAVHRLYAGDGAPAVEQAFPGTMVDGNDDRERLAQRVLGDPAALARLEAIVHPLVRDAEHRFILHSAKSGARIAVLDIPLLLETGGQSRVDAVIVVSAPADLQRQRVLSRPNMSPEKLDAILAKQMPDAEKRRRAHFVVDTSRSFDFARHRVRGILRAVAVIPGRTPWLSADLRHPPPC